MRGAAIAVLLAPLWVAPSAAQNVQVQDSHILRACREIHRAAQAQEPEMVVRPNGIAFNCRLVNANGSTLAQVSPEEVCERVTGGREWIRGAGTQIMCLASSTGTRPPDLPCPQPKDVQIDQSDVAQACAKSHRSGNAGAESLRITVNGPEFRCRLTSSAGFTISGVTPEQVCEVKTGSRYWCNTETTAYCRGPDYERPVNPIPNPQPKPGGGGETAEAQPLNPKPKPRKEDQPDGGENNAKVQPQEEIESCKPMAPGGEAVVNVTREGEARSPIEAITHPMVTCGSGQGMLPEKLCPTITGSAEWYLSATGFSETKDGILWPDWIVVCRGNGPRERQAFADIVLACNKRGKQLGGSNGFMQSTEPFCVDASHRSTPISIAAVCAEQYGTSAHKSVGPTSWCLP